jgi:hypothetical protein
MENVFSIISDLAGFIALVFVVVHISEHIDKDKIIHQIAMLRAMAKEGSPDVYTEIMKRDQQQEAEKELWE